MVAVVSYDLRFIIVIILLDALSMEPSVVVVYKRTRLEVMLKD